MEELQLAARRRGNLWSALQKSVCQMACQVDLVCILCDSIHCLEKPLRAMITEQRLKARLVFVEEAVAAWCSKCNIASACVVGSSCTTDVGPAGKSQYKTLAPTVNLSVGSDQQRDRQDEMASLLRHRGSDDPEVVALLQEIIDEVCQEEAACPQAIILAEPDLAQVPVRCPAGVQLLDPTKVLAEHLASLALRRP